MKELLKCLLGILLVALISYGLGYAVGRKKAEKDEPKIVRDTVAFTYYDTLTIEKPVPKYSYIHDTIRTYFQTVYHDTVLVDVPIERKVYAEDSLYRAVVSGWHPQLDSLTIFPQTTEITITNTVRIPPPKWSLGITAGPSVLLIPTGELKFGMGITAGVHYRF